MGDRMDDSETNKKVESFINPKNNEKNPTDSNNSNKGNPKNSNESTLSNRNQRGRYFRYNIDNNKGKSHGKRKPDKFKNNFFAIRIPREFLEKKNILDGSGNVPSTTSFLKPYEPIIYDPHDPVYEEDPVNKEEQNNKGESNEKETNKDKKNQKRQQQKQKNTKNQNKTSQEKNLPTKMTTINKVKQKKIDDFTKIKEKIKKSQNVLKKNKQKQQKDEIISIEDSEIDEEDVIVIPVPEPPVISIISDDENDENDEHSKEEIQENDENSIDPDEIKIKTEPEEEVETTKEFIKPKILKSASAPASTVQSNNSSRCTSPSSTMSADDFLSNKERSCLLETTIVNDDDLTFGETVDSYVQRQKKSNLTAEQIENFNALNNSATTMPPPVQSNEKENESTNKKNKKQKFCEKNYQVKESACRAADVYDESESDISVYSKGSMTSSKKTMPKPIPEVIGDKSSSSSTTSSDEDPIDSIQKIRRLKKRRTSSKGDSDKRNQSQSDSDSEINKNSTGLPYISRGEAVEKVRKRRKSNHSKSTTEVNSSDNEFITQFNKIVRKNSSKKAKPKQNSKNEDTTNTSEDDENNENETITARSIAEDVIAKKMQKNKEPETVEQVIESDTIKINENELPETVEAGEDTQNMVIDTNPTIEEEEKSTVTQKQIDEAYAEIDKIMGDSNESNIESNPNQENIIEVNNEEFTVIDEVTEEIEFDEFIEKGSILQQKKYEGHFMEVDGTQYYVIDSQSTDHIGWCEEMIRFYDMSWGGENLTVYDLQKKLDPNSNWDIIAADKIPRFKRDKMARMKCFNCCEFGHTAARCSLPRKPSICYMCGGTGHREPRCPNTICLKCGAKTSAYVKGCRRCANDPKCFICNTKGHNMNSCPDKWRRYHSTITPNTEPNSRVIYNKFKYCCVCASRGHLAENCKYSKICLEYPPATSQIKSHKGIFVSQPNPTRLTKSTLPYNLLYEPNDNIKFSFSVENEFNSNQYYARFLKAVKFDSLPVFKISEPKPKSKKKKENKNKKLAILNLQKKIQKNTKNNNKNDKNQTKTDKNESTKESDNFKCPDKVSQNKNKDENKPEDDETSNSKKKNDPTTISKDVVVDSDSNYSFSDHFDFQKGQNDETNVQNDESNIGNDESKAQNESNAQNKTPLQNITSALEKRDLSKPQRISKPMGNLDDFIPLSGSKTKSKNVEVETESNEKNETPKSKKGSSKNNEVLTFNLTDSGFIPITNDDSDEEEEEDFSKGIGDGFGISQKFRFPSESSEIDENDFPDIPCVGKIFLPKNFSDYLLSPDGNKFLIENSNKYNIKTSIDWTSVGNVLVLEGSKRNQSSFHITLMLALRTLPKKMKNDLIEKSLRVPRKRSILIKFLQDDLERLDGRLGNVYDLHKQLQTADNSITKNGLKQAQRIRTKLNMILFGQAGLRDGRTNLERLINHFLQLIKDKDLTENNVTNDVRDEIDKLWKYIFSPLEHQNYEELVDNYYELKRRNNLPYLRIRDRLKNKNFDNKNNLSNNHNSFLERIENFNKNNSLKRKISESSTPVKSLMDLKLEKPSELDEEISNFKVPKLLLNITNSNENNSLINSNNSSRTSTPKRIYH